MFMFESKLPLGSFENTVVTFLLIFFHEEISISLIPEPDKDMKRKENYLELVLKSCRGNTRPKAQGYPSKCSRSPDVEMVLVLGGTLPGA